LAMVGIPLTSCTINMQIMKLVYSGKFKTGILTSDSGQNYWNSEMLVLRRRKAGEPRE